MQRGTIVDTLKRQSDFGPRTNKVKLAGIVGIVLLRIHGFVRIAALRYRNAGLSVYSMTRS